VVGGLRPARTFHAGTGLGRDPLYQWRQAPARRVSALWIADGV